MLGIVLQFYLIKGFQLDSTKMDLSSLLIENIFLYSTPTLSFIQKKWGTVVNKIIVIIHYVSLFNKLHVFFVQAEYPFSKTTRRLDQSSHPWQWKRWEVSSALHCTLRKSLIIEASQIIGSDCRGVRCRQFSPWDYRRTTRAITQHCVWWGKKGEKTVFRFINMAHVLLQPWLHCCSQRSIRNYTGLYTKKGWTMTICCIEVI